MNSRPSIGAAFVVITNENQRAMRSALLRAANEVPSGRILFVVWTQDEGWASSPPVESIAVDTLLGNPSKRDNSVWEFYGCGTSRLYGKASVRPAEFVMWVGFRKLGEKAYVRKRKSQLTPENLFSSMIPVSDKAFTRDVANNVWHLPLRRGLDRVIARLQSLTTWSDERAVVLKSGRRTLRRHETMDLSQDLIPVAQKVLYEFEGFKFATPNGKKPGTVEQAVLFH